MTILYVLAKTGLAELGQVKPCQKKSHQLRFAKLAAFRGYSFRYCAGAGISFPVTAGLLRLAKARLRQWLDAAGFESGIPGIEVPPTSPVLRLIL